LFCIQIESSPFKGKGAGNGGAPLLIVKIPIPLVKE